MKCSMDVNLLLFSAAMTETAADVDDIAAALEDAVFSEFKSTETKYKNRIRSRIANLKVSFLHIIYHIM